MPFLTDAERDDLRIDRMIFHVVGPDLEEPVLLAEFDPPIFTEFFLKRIREEGAKGKSAVADWLKDILKTTNVPFVLSGMPETVQIIEADDQLYSLCEEPVEITKYDWEDAASRKAWRAILAKIDMQMPFNERSNLAEEETAFNLFVCCDGNLRRLRALLKIAVCRAIRNKGKVVVWDDLAAGYHRLPKLVGVKGNPFDRNGLFK